MLNRSLVRRCNAAAAAAATASATAYTTASATAAPSGAAAKSAKTAVGNSDVAVKLEVAAAAPPKSPFQEKMAGWKESAKEGMRHLYHGFRLFFINTRLAWKYSRQLRKGVALTRRERLLLESSTKDLLRMVPFSVFIIVPFGELLLPIVLKMFPSMIPSTFETESLGRNRSFGEALNSLRARQRLSEFLSANALATFTAEEQEVVRRSVRGDSITPKDIRLVAHYFNRDGPFSVYNVPDNIAIGLGRVVGVHKWYHSMMPSRLAAIQLRRNICKRYHIMREDDRMLRAEGLESLSFQEAQKACESRGMRWTENKETLDIQLEWWISLARDPTIPYNTLNWIKPNRYSLKKSMHNLPIDQRRQLLGIQNLPPALRSTLEAVCETVDTVSKIDEHSSADKIAEKISVITDSAKKSAGDIGVQGAQGPIGEFLTPENVDEMFKTIQGNLLVEEEPVRVADVIDAIGRHTHFSGHVVSSVFDAFDYGAGSKPITKASLLAIGARCREAAVAPPKEAPPKEPAQKEEPSKEAAMAAKEAPEEKPSKEAEKVEPKAEGAAKAEPTA